MRPYATRDRGSWQCRVVERGQANARQQLRHARLGACRMSASLRRRSAAASGSRVRAVGLADAGLAHRVQNPIALGGATALGGLLPFAPAGRMLRYSARSGRSGVPLCAFQ